MCFMGFYCTVARVFFSDIYCACEIDIYLRVLLSIPTWTMNFGPDLLLSVGGVEVFMFELHMLCRLC